MSMTPKEKADCLVELHKEESNRHQQLTTLEFKVNILLWTFITLAGYFLLKEILPKCTNEQALLFGIVYFLISVLLVLAHYFFWMFPITRSQASSAFFIRSYQCKIEELVEFRISSIIADTRPIITSFSHFPTNYKRWIIAEVGITGFLLFVIFLFGCFQVIIR